MSEFASETAFSRKETLFREVMEYKAKFMGYVERGEPIPDHELDAYMILEKEYIDSKRAA